MHRGVLPSLLHAAGALLFALATFGAVRGDGVEAQANDPLILDWALIRVGCVELQYDENLASRSVPATSAFSVSINGGTALEPIQGEATVRVSDSDGQAYRTPSALRRFEAIQRNGEGTLIWEPPGRVGGRPLVGCEYKVRSTNPFGTLSGETRRLGFERWGGDHSRRARIRKRCLAAN